MCYELVRPELRNVSIVIKLPHGHIWRFQEVDAFVDSALRKGQPLARPAAMKISGELATTQH